MNKRCLILLIFLLATSAHAMTTHGSLSPDETARILAGMNPQVQALGVFSDWKANYPNSRLNTTQQNLIREFSQTHLTAANRNTQVVFYPFGGPDVMFPSLFFPNMKTLILAGLESPGRLPTNLTPASASSKISEIRRAYWEVFSRGYYVTSKMSYELREFGTTTMISVGLVMLGNKIISVDQGPLPRSVRVVYSTPQNEVRRIYYFQQDLSDKNISAAFTAFVQEMNVDTTFYKASSYVPQLPNFTKVNALALQSRYFVQSDTGISVSTLAKAGDWKVHLFGQYVPPAPMFGVKVQPGLAWAYANSVCQTKDAVAIGQFKAIWRNLDPCTIRMTDEGAISTYDGPLSFPYDYAGKLSRRNVINFASSFIYAVRSDSMSEKR